VFDLFAALVTLTCDDPHSRRVLREWLHDQPAIVRPVGEVGGFEWAGCTTSSSVYVSLWTGDVPVTLTGAVSHGIAQTIKPLPRPLVRYTIPRA
jgi:hypothetical protein